MTTEIKKLNKEKLIQLISTKKYNDENIELILSSLLNDYRIKEDGIYKGGTFKLDTPTFEDDFDHNGRPIHNKKLKEDKDGKVTLTTSIQGSDWRIVLKVKKEDI